MRATNQSLLCSLIIVCFLSISSTLAILHFTSSSYQMKNACYYTYEIPNADESFFGYPLLSNPIKNYHLLPQEQMHQLSPDNYLKEIIQRIQEALQRQSTQQSSTEKEVLMRELLENIIEF